MTLTRRFIAGFRGTRIGVSACRRIGVSRQAHRISYFFLMGTDHPLNRHAHTPMRPYADPSPPAARSNVKRPSGTRIPMDGHPGDKSPGYYRVSLRDEGKTGFQMSKLQGPSGRRQPAIHIRRFIAGLALHRVCVPGRVVPKRALKLTRSVCLRASWPAMSSPPRDSGDSCGLEIYSNAS
jgi:hypothetical protein